MDNDGVISKDELVNIDCFCSLCCKQKLKPVSSSGTDGVTQECLLLGTEAFAIPLTHIINKSISSGVVPTKWKEADLFIINKSMFVLNRS